MPLPAKDRIEIHQCVRYPLPVSVQTILIGKAQMVRIARANGDLNADLELTASLHRYISTIYKTVGWSEERPALRA